MEGPFKPIDVVRSLKIGPRKRGRKPKPSMTAVNQLQEAKTEILQLDSPKDSNKGLYHTSSFQTKLTLLQDFIIFTNDRPNDELGEQVALNEFFRRKSKMLNIPVSTLKTWCRQYTEDNSMLIRLELQCTGAKRAQQSGQVYKDKADSHTRLR